MFFIVGYKGKGFFPNYTFWSLNYMGGGSEIRKILFDYSSMKSMYLIYQSTAIYLYLE